MTRILLGGVAVLDLVFYLDTMPDRPEKYRAKDAAVVGGGCAANAAVAVARLGGDAVLLSRLGDDLFGDLIVKDLLAETVDCSAVLRHPGHRSTLSSIYVSGDGERQIVSFRDWSMPDIVPPLPLHQPVNGCLADTRWAAVATELMRFASDHGLPGVIDAEAPLAGCEEALRWASHVAFSVQGLRDLSGDVALEEGLRIAREEIGDTVIVTDGENGVYWLDEAGAAQHEPAFKIHAVDTLGAGDVWHGGLVMGLARGFDLRRAIRYANGAAALKCTVFGGRTGTPSHDRLMAFLEGQT